MSNDCCPNCNLPTVHEFRPFCSARCKLVDLQHWFSESYAIPVEESTEQEDIEENVEKS